MTRQTSSHPDPATLLAWATGADDGATAQHVSACARCQRVSDQWRATAAGVSATLKDEADAAFTAERLERQRAEVMRRIRAGAGARVLRFPAPTAGPRPARLLRHDLRRWVAAAAVVGLIVGTLAGRFLLDPHRQVALARARGTVPAMVAPASPRAAGSGASATASGADEAFLVELDAAVFASSPRSLQALDALTPGLDR